MVTKEQVLKIANLSRLKIAENELDKFTGQMNGILQFIERLDQLDTKAIEPTSHAVKMTNAFRKDERIQNRVQEDVLARAPESEANFFRVPKVI